jgi:hypothetical protein
MIAALALNARVGSALKDVSRKATISSRTNWIGTKVGHVADAGKRIKKWESERELRRGRHSTK